MDTKTNGENTNRDDNNRQTELNALTALTNAVGANPDTTDVNPDPSGQKGKLAFLQKSPDAEIYNKNAQQTPVSPYQLMAGTIIPASLITGLNSDLPGFVIAQVTENVFDTVSGQYLLIPQGTRLIGKYDSVIAPGQERAPGYAGLSDKVNLHTWKLIKGIALSTLLGVGTELSFGNNESDLVKAIRESTQQSTNRAGQKLVDSYPGYPANHHSTPRLATTHHRQQGHHHHAIYWKWWLICQRSNLENCQIARQRKSHSLPVRN